MSWPRIEPSEFQRPQRLCEFGAMIIGVLPTYWIVPARCYLGREKHPIRDELRDVSEVFYRFKKGEVGLAPLFVLGMLECLGDLGVDVIIPVPLSPEKRAAGVPHRTLVLAELIGKRVQVPVFRAVELQTQISKTRITGYGRYNPRYEEEYFSALSLEPGLGSGLRMLVVDDALTHGGTFAAVARRLFPHGRVAGLFAGQMLVQQVVKSTANILDHSKLK